MNKITSDPRLEPVVRTYLQHMLDSGRAPVTVTVRRNSLARFSRWLGGPILYANLGDLEDYRHERAQDLQQGSLRAELSSIRAFFAWTVRKSLRDDNPALDLELPTAKRRVPRPMSEADFRAALVAADPQDAVILGLAGFAGLRALEIARADWHEVDLRATQPMLVVPRGKGDHGRIVPLSPAMVSLLLALGHRRGPVISRRDGSAGYNSASAISMRAARYLRRQGIDDRLHSLRHRFGTMTYRAVRDLRAVQELLGHSSPVTTAGYAKSADDVTLQAVMAAGQIAA